MKQKVTFTLNRRPASAEVDPQEPILYVLRDRFGLDGPKFGCGLAQCGACTILLNGAPVRSCVVPAAGVQGGAVTTIEGLGTPEHPHPLQTAFIAEQAVQCGYCANGMIVNAAALLAKTPQPSEREIKTAMAGNLCRCGTHVRIVRAIKRAAAAGVKRA